MAVIVDVSEIEGLGVFAARDYRKGETVMRWDASVILSQRQADNVPNGIRKFLVRHRGRFIFAQPPERFLNHSCEPNTRQGRLCDIASRDIKKGEELTTDYSGDAAQLKMKCNCGSRRCRKIIY